MGKFYIAIIMMKRDNWKSIQIMQNKKCMNTVMMKIII